MNDATTPWIDPELVAAGKLLQEKGLVAPDRTVASIPEVRAATDRIGAFLGEGSVPLKNERDLSLPGPHGQVPCRLYLPDGVERPPLIVYAHGGGFMQGSLNSWDHFLRDLVRQSGVAALSVDYQLSPEVKFPVAFEEMVAIEGAIAAGRQAEIPALMSDRWLADATLFGPAAGVRDGVAAWREAGISTPILVPSSATGNQLTAIEEIFAAFA